MADDFQHRHVRALGKRVHRLGLAVTHGIPERDIPAALEAGPTYVFWNPTARQLVAPLREALRRDRERFAVATGPSLGWFRGPIRRRTEEALRLLGTDYLDVLQLYWLGVTSALTAANLEELVRLREEGKIRALGASLHDRQRAGRLAEDSPLDVFMIRYNAAHPGAERDVFPHLERRRPAVVAYTATSWRRLLSPPRGWQGPVMTAGDCYRFCLSSPHVDVALCSPASLAELREDLAALERGALSPDEEAWMRRFGRAVHG